jgi:hypothetical protein
MTDEEFALNTAHKSADAMGLLYTLGTFMCLLLAHRKGALGFLGGFITL